MSFIPILFLIYSSTEIPACPNGWEDFGDGTTVGPCLYFVRSKATWYSTRSFCMALGADLAKVTGDLHQDVVAYINDQPGEKACTQLDCLHCYYFFLSCFLPFLFWFSIFLNFVLFCYFSSSSSTSSSFNLHCLMSSFDTPSKQTTINDYSGGYFSHLQTPTSKTKPFGSVALTKGRRAGKAIRGGAKGQENKLPFSPKPSVFSFSLSFHSLVVFGVSK